MRQQNAAGGDREAVRTQMRATMEKQQAEIRAVLTPDQQRQFDQNAAEARDRMERGGGRPGGVPPR
jgi:Spy/CpxP family protein refolding chaperone